MSTPSGHGEKDEKRPFLEKWYQERSFLHMIKMFNIKKHNKIECFFDNF